MAYIAEVWLALFLSWVLLPFAVVFLGFIVANSLNWFFAKLTEFPIPFVVVSSSPIWFTFLLIAIEPFTKKRWRKLEVVE
jgi:hypothetical protein